MDVQTVTIGNIPFICTALSYLSNSAWPTVNFVCSRTLLVDERYFASHKQHVVLKALWHPGSPSHSHLCVITSDNTLR